MNKSVIQTKPGPRTKGVRAGLYPGLVGLLLIVFSVCLSALVAAQEEKAAADEKIPVFTTPLQPSFRIGERLTYNITFEKFKNGGYAEIYVVSQGKLGDKNAVELVSRIKTDDLVSAAFYLVDEVRKTYAAAETGLPLYAKITDYKTGLPEETVSNYLVAPVLDFDLVTLIYRVRNVGGVGNFTLRENGRTYPVSFQNTVSETVETPAGSFETSVSVVESEYFTERGISKLRINFSVDEEKIPALIRFETEKGSFYVELASLQVINNSSSDVPAPIFVKPTPARTPTPVPTPTPYIENRALSDNLSFVIGETLEYRVTDQTRPIGNFILQARERRLFKEKDSLFLTARITEREPDSLLFAENDRIDAWVDPETLSPKFIEIKFSGGLSSINQTVDFNQQNGLAAVSGTNRVEIPVGTHSLLSLAYAIRSFNLKPSPDPNNPVNDTRVAVFLDGRPYVFTLRPANAEIINFRGEKVPAQLISIKTGNPVYDALNPRLWLSADADRLPLRFAAGRYQFELISKKILPPPKL